MAQNFTKHDDFVEKLFSESKIFEEYILGVYNDVDREEIMQILSKRLIQGALKEELNFVHMKSLKSFKYSLIVNLLFKEFANEWISFAQEHLEYTKAFALDELQDKRRVRFIVSLVENYFRIYKIEFVKAICDTFIELVATATVTTARNKILTEVISLEILKVNHISLVRDYYQLRVIAREALDAKNIKLTKMKNEITEITFRLSSGMLSTKEKEEFTNRLVKIQANVESIESKSLIYFNETLKKIRDLIFEYLMQKA